MSEPLASVIEALAQRISGGGFRSEADISQGVVKPVLRELGWPVFDVQVVASGIQDWFEECRLRALPSGR